jgi:hypothetical protein
MQTAIGYPCPKCGSELRPAQLVCSSCKSLVDETLAKLASAPAELDHCEIRRAVEERHGVLAPRSKAGEIAPLVVPIAIGVYIVATTAWQLIVAFRAGSMVVDFMPLLMEAWLVSTAYVTGTIIFLRTPQTTVQSHVEATLPLDAAKGRLSDAVLRGTPPVMRTFHLQSVTDKITLMYISHATSSDDTGWLTVQFEAIDEKRTRVSWRLDLLEPKDRIDRSFIKDILGDWIQEQLLAPQLDSVRSPTEPASSQSPP